MPPSEYMELGAWSTTRMSPLRDPLSRPQLAFLRTFEHAAPLEGNGGVWAVVLGAVPETISKHFVSSALIELAPPETQVACAMGAIEIKAHLRLHNSSP